MQKTRYTTKDIAQLANVSRGTVDRVLHKRGSVSEEARKRVEKILQEIDYQPNIIAKVLQGNQKIKIAVIMPSPKNDPFWEFPHSGIKDAQTNVELFDISYEQFFFDQQDKESFNSVTHEVIKAKPNGIILAPFFFKESLSFLTLCHEQKLPCITFNTHFESNHILSFVGQNLYTSGRVAASLLQQVAHQMGTILVIHFHENVSNAVHMQEKEAGFVSYFAEQNEDWKIQSLHIKDDPQRSISSELDAFLGSGEKIAGVFVTTSKAYMIARYLKDHHIHCRLVGYDLIEENVHYLRSGDIDFLIRQNSKQQALSAAHLMVDYLILKKEIPKEVILPLDIINKENLNSFLS